MQYYARTIKLLGDLQGHVRSEPKIARATECGIQVIVHVIPTTFKLKSGNESQMDKLDKIVSTFIYTIAPGLMSDVLIVFAALVMFCQYRNPDNSCYSNPFIT